MRAFAYLSQGRAGWVEKEVPRPTGVDGVIRPLLATRAWGRWWPWGRGSATSRWGRSWWSPR